VLCFDGLDWAAGGHDALVLGYGQLMVVRNFLFFFIGPTNRLRGSWQFFFF
jgi:hypothetical protein